MFHFKDLLEYIEFLFFPINKTPSYFIIYYSPLKSYQIFTTFLLQSALNRQQSELKIFEIQAYSICKILIEIHVIVGTTIYYLSYVYRVKII